MKDAKKEIEDRVRSWSPVENGYFRLYTDKKLLELECWEAQEYLERYRVPYKEIDIWSCDGVNLDISRTPALDTPWGVFEGVHAIKIFAFRYYITDGFRFI
jgi:hypothetical protein